jgi:5-methylcytosine-specific restriction enzyme A
VPSAPNHPCSYPGCPLLTDKGRCEKHRKQERKQIDERRGSAHSRGYTSRWAKYSKARLAQYPLCVMCNAEGHTVAATCTDHIKAHKGDMELFWDPTNHQSLCKHHNDSKAVTEGRWGRGGMKSLGALASRPGARSFFYASKMKVEKVTYGRP